MVDVSERDEPVSLAPLEVEDALRALLAVKPDEADDSSGEDAEGQEAPEK